MDLVIYENNRANLRDLITATGLVISNWIQIDDFSARVTVKFDGWSRKTIGHFFSTMSSSVHHFKSIGEFKLDIQFRNVQFGSKLAIFILCDLEIWWLTFENNRAPLLYHIKLCASLQSHRWSQTWVTVRKRSIRVKIGNFSSRVTLKFDGWPWKTIGHLSYAPPGFVHHFKAMSSFNLE